jgi:DNA-binding response OmpR family regulator
MESDAASSKVLVVDDEHSIVDAVATALRYEGFEVAEAMTGREALAAAQETAFDLIVLDVMLPDINGKEVCQRVRSDKTMDTVKIICISGMVEDDKVDELKAAGANDFLRKPFEVDRLVDRICQLLDIESAARA